ncbi:MAG: sulfurtransferase-like selenium metabolism protein YedF [Lactobacillus sp.]|jgi:TusA-related sulfurtransferase|nr:sulfurtransferase-like selenium metabolism protein YedF [Lactobacillus sp.]
MKTAYNIDYLLDLKGEPCPFPAMSTIDAYDDMSDGEVIEVLSDCPQSINSIPVDAKKRGHEVLLVQQDGPTFRYVIRVHK